MAVGQDDRGDLPPGLDRAHEAHRQHVVGHRDMHLAQPGQAALQDLVGGMRGHVLHVDRRDRPAFMHERALSRQSRGDVPDQPARVGAERRQSDRSGSAAQRARSGHQHQAGQMVVLDAVEQQHLLLLVAATLGDRQLVPDAGRQRHQTAGIGNDPLPVRAGRRHVQQPLVGYRPRRLRAVMRNGARRCAAAPKRRQPRQRRREHGGKARAGNRGDQAQAPGRRPAPEPPDHAHRLKALRSAWRPVHAGVPAGRRSG